MLFKDFLILYLQVWWTCVTEGISNNDNYMQWQISLARINRAGGLYGRILTEVVTADPKAVQSVHTTEVKILSYRPPARLIRYLLYGANKSNLIRSM